MILLLITNNSSLISFGRAGNNDTAVIGIDQHDLEKHKLRTLDHLSVRANKDQLVKEGDEVILNAGKNFEKGKTDELTYLWTQLEPKKPQIKIHDGDTSKVKFTAPDVAHSTVFKIKLSVNDGHAEITDIIRVKVLDILEHDKSENENNKNETTFIDNRSQYNKNDIGHKSIDTTIIVPNDKVVINSTKEQKNIGSDNSDKENEQDKEDTITHDLREDKSTNDSSNGGGSQENANSTLGSLSLECEPSDVKVIEGIESSIMCIVKNKTQKALEIELECSGVEDNGVDCYVNGEQGRTGKLMLKEMSSESFPIVMSITSPNKVPTRSFPFTITATCKSSDVC